MDSSKDDASCKKRDSETNKSEKISPKKIRSVRTHAGDEATASPSVRVNDTDLEQRTASLNNHEPNELFSPATNHHHGSRQTWDLESALHRMVRVGKDISKNEPVEANSSNVDAIGLESSGIESLTSTACLKWRLGHGGDASTIAALCRQASESYRSMQHDMHSTNDITNSLALSPTDELEARLADGLGDEYTPPSVFALLGELCERKCTDDAKLSSELHTVDGNVGAVALMTQVWENGLRMLQIEWLYIRRDHGLSDLLERRLWLRLSTLALMTSSQGIVVKETAKPVALIAHVNEERS
jgi:hypothetical protein